MKHFYIMNICYIFLVLVLLLHLTLKALDFSYYYNLYHSDIFSHTFPTLVFKEGLEYQLIYPSVFLKHGCMCQQLFL